MRRVILRLAVLASLILPALAARADLLIPRHANGVTVEFTDGRRLEGVDVAWEPRERTLAVTRDGITLHAGAAEIRAVRDATGNDITATLLPRSPAPRQTEPTGTVPLVTSPPVSTQPAPAVRETVLVALPPTTAQEPPAPARPVDGRRFAIALAPIAGQGWLSHDAWFGGQEAGSRVGLRLRVAATPVLYVTTEFTRQLLDETAAGEGVGHLDLFAVGLGLRPNVGERIRAWPFLEFGAGVARPGGSGAGDLLFARQTNPLLQARAGLMLPVIPRLEIELSGCAQLTGEEFADFSLGNEGGLVYGAELGVSLLLGP